MIDVCCFHETKSLRWLLQDVVYLRPPSKEAMTEKIDHESEMSKSLYSTIGIMMRDDKQSNKMLFRQRPEELAS